MKQAKAKLGVDELKNTVTSKGFASRLASIYRYTNQSCREAAFAVYSRSGTISLSRVIRATPEDTLDDDYLGVDPLLGGAVDVKDIALRFRKGRFECRPELTALIHTHPREVTPLPSPGDLEIYKERHFFNPDVLEGVLTHSKEAGRMSLLLYRASPCREFVPQILQAMNPEIFPPLEAMHEAGLNTVTLEHNSQGGQIVTDPCVLEKLYS